MKGRVKLRITNSLDVPRRVVLEPWGGEYTLPPNKMYEIRAEGDLKLPLGVELLGDRILVHCFDSAGADMSIFDGDTELKAS
jgi:hypothetical protein